MEIKKREQTAPVPIDACHDGAGTLMCRSMLEGFSSNAFLLLHADDMPAGVSIGLHEHTDNEEIYYLISGRGLLTFDGNEYEMESGDASLCPVGHAHAFRALEDCVLLVIGGPLDQKSSN